MSEDAGLVIISFKKNDGTVPDGLKSWRYDIGPSQEARALLIVSEQTIADLKEVVL